MGIGAALRSFGTTFLRGMCFEDWRALLRENRYAISPEYRFRAAATTAICITNSALRGGDDALLPQVRRTKVESPLFILGHFRSGTTFLHQLMALDCQFAYPNVYEIHFPQTFLTTEDLVAGPLGWLVGNSFRDIDSVRETISSPAEDEVAMCNMTGISPLLSSVFPARADYYDRFLSFRHASAQETERWRSALVLFLQKLTWRYRRPLVIKSPGHTCRIALLLKSFPDARFVHIHRHPFDVFSSTRRIVEPFFRKAQLQRSPVPSWDDQIIDQYRHMYEVFHEEKHLLSSDNLAEIRYEDLVRNPVETVQGIYHQLGIANFAAFEQPLRRRCDALRGYKTNASKDIPADLKSRLASAWTQCFDAWDYDPFRNPAASQAPAATP